MSTKNNIEELKAKILAGTATIDDLIAYARAVDKKSVDEVNTELSSEDVAALSEAYMNLYKDIEADPDRIKAAKLDAAGKSVSQGIQVLLGLRDIAASGKQIKVSEAQLAQLKKPARAAKLRPSQALRRAVSDAQQDKISDAPIAIAKEGIRENFASDISTARQASGGQAGTYAALTQLGANRRRKSVADLMPLVAQLRQQQTGRLDNLIGMELGERANIAENDRLTYNTDLNQYNRESEAAGRLGAIGRNNMRNSLHNLADQAPVNLGGLAGVFSQGGQHPQYRNSDWYRNWNQPQRKGLFGKRYDPSYSGDPAWDAYEQTVDEDLVFGDSRQTGIA